MQNKLAPFVEKIRDAFADSGIAEVPEKITKPVKAWESVISNIIACCRQKGEEENPTELTFTMEYVTTVVTSLRLGLQKIAAFLRMLDNGDDGS